MVGQVEGRYVVNHDAQARYGTRREVAPVHRQLQRRSPCQSFSTWERLRKRGTLWLIGDPPASLCPRSGSMPTRSSLFFSWSTMVPVINTTWPQAFEGKRTRSPGLRVACSLLLILRIHDGARS